MENKFNKNNETINKKIEEKLEENEEEKKSEKKESQKNSSYQPRWPEHFKKNKDEERRRRLENPNWFREQI